MSCSSGVGKHLSADYKNPRPAANLPRKTKSAWEVIRPLVIYPLKGSIVCRISVFLPRWLRFDLFLNTYISLNQRGFVNFYDTKIGGVFGHMHVVYENLG